MLLPLPFLLALIVRFGYELSIDGPDPWAGAPALRVLGFSALGFVALHEFASVLLLLSRSRRPELARIGRSLYAVFDRSRPLLPPLAYLLLLIFGGWLPFVRFHLEPSLLVWSEFLIFAPYFFYELLGVLGELRIYGRADRSIPNLLRTWIFAPILLLLNAWMDVLALHPLVRAAVQELHVAAVLGVGLGALCILWILPHWLVRILPRFPIDSGLRAQFSEVVKRSGLRVTGIHGIATRGRSLNAAVVGFLPFARPIVLTDALLAWFPVRELRAVLAHELGHLRGRHTLRLLLFFAVLPFLLVQVLLPTSADEETMMLAFLFALLVMLLPLSILSRRFEHEADLHAAEVEGGTESIRDALTRVGEKLPGKGDRGALRHPSLSARLAFLERSKDPGFLAAWARRGFLMQATLFLILGLAIGFYVSDARKAWPEERPSFLLAAGYPSEAAAHLGGEMEEEQASHLRNAILRLRLLLQEGDTEGPGLTESLRKRSLNRALKDLREGDREGAYGWLLASRLYGVSNELEDAIFHYLEAWRDSDEKSLLEARSILAFLDLSPRYKKAVQRMVNG